MTTTSVGDTDSARRMDLLVAGAATGDRAATEELLRLIRPLIVRYCRTRLGGYERAQSSPDDVAQEVCLAVLRALPSYRDQGRPFLAFVYGIAQHKVIDAHRSAGRDRSDPTDEVPEELDERDGPEQRAVDVAESEVMRELLDRLPEKQREVLVMRVVVGMSAEETAEAIGSTAGAVRVAQHRALAKLRQLIEEQGGRGPRAGAAPAIPAPQRPPGPAPAPPGPAPAGPPGPRIAAPSPRRPLPPTRRPSARTTRPAGPIGGPAAGPAAPGPTPGPVAPGPTTPGPRSPGGTPAGPTGTAPTAAGPHSAGPTGAGPTTPAPGPTPPGPGTPGPRPASPADHTVAFERPVVPPPSDDQDDLPEGFPTPDWEAAPRTGDIALDRLLDLADDHVGRVVGAGRSGPRGVRDTGPRSRELADEDARMRAASDEFRARHGRPGDDPTRN